MRIVFMGSPEFAIPALRALNLSHQISAVYCQVAKPAGRGNELRKCAVQSEAERMGLIVRTPKKLRNMEGEFEFLSSLDLDAIVVAAYGIILPKNILDLPKNGCFNIHASLLPRWRGASPIHAAINAGDDETGVTIMKMDEGLDTGPILLQKKTKIAKNETTGTLHAKLAKLGAKLILPALVSDFEPEFQLANDTYNYIDRDNTVVKSEETYAPKLTREHGRIDWWRDADNIERQIRAYDPWPGTFTTMNGQVLKVLSAEVETNNGTPREVLDDKLLIGCGWRSLRLKRIQLAGKKAMDADDFLRGTKITIGTKLGD